MGLGDPILNLMVRISSENISWMVQYCLETSPNEACGLLLGVGESVKFVRGARSVAPSPYQFTMEPLDILAIDKEAEDLEVEIVGLFHSHTTSEAYPSETDVDACPDDRWVHFLVSLKSKPYRVRAFKIADRKITEIEISCDLEGVSSDDLSWTIQL